MEVSLSFTTTLNSDEDDKIFFREILPPHPPTPFKDTKTLTSSSLKEFCRIEIILIHQIYRVLCWLAAAVAASRSIQASVLHNLSQLSKGPRLVRK